MSNDETIINFVLLGAAVAVAVAVDTALVASVQPFKLAIALGFKLASRADLSNRILSLDMFSSHARRQEAMSAACSHSHVKQLLTTASECSSFMEYKLCYHSRLAWAELQAIQSAFESSWQHLAVHWFVLSFMLPEHRSAEARIWCKESTFSAWLRIRCTWALHALAWAKQIKTSRCSFAYRSTLAFHAILLRLFKSYHVIYSQYGDCCLRSKLQTHTKSVTNCKITQHQAHKVNFFGLHVSSIHASNLPSATQTMQRSQIDMFLWQSAVL